ncbi:hypothetical protein QWT69_06585 [Sporosarcina oncorhynchi]|uniref:Uncharacterized protein n=1 Tax=Sporosarcina oncorhynchi TaxID=3056444 RepID=A0ABZ0L9C3_9BACL|nr:hypothetical protein [Sporosarcina sp. T2O-4]WOV88769.1 hypothetical protein QWT69_06585 [Sporosarcina sp. T2O-4]
MKNVTMRFKSRVGGLEQSESQRTGYTYIFVHFTEIQASFRSLVFNNRAISLNIELSYFGSGLKVRKWNLIIPLILVIIFIFFINGYRFTALSAAKSNSFLSKDASLVERNDANSSVIFLFKSDRDEIYQTVLSEKSGPFYNSSVSTDIPYSSDAIQTVGGISVTTKKGAATLLSVISYDEEVAYIEAGVEPNVEKKEISKGERITFLFPFMKQIDFLYPTAFNKNGEKLYYYGYPKDTNVIKIEDLKWHKINGQ